MNFPNFIGIGAPKAGTTWLARCLGEHPDVFMAAVKETEYFKFTNYQQRVDEYTAHFEGSKGKRAVGEFSVRYLALPGIPERIKQMLPQVRLIVSLRNPADQVYSNYWHLQRQNFNLANPGKAPHSFEEALEKHREFLLEPGRYASHLKRWFDHFPREQMLVFLYDDIQHHPSEVLHDVFEFLGVYSNFQPPSTSEKGSAVRRGTSPRSENAARWHQSVYSGLTRGIYSPMKRMLGVRNAARVKEALRVRSLMERLFMRNGYPPMSPQVHALLHREFEAEVAELAEITGLKFDTWN